jgi:hypothetical protein
MSANRLFESILAVEEQHAEELASMRQDILRHESSVGANNASNSSSSLTETSIDLRSSAI